LARNVVLDALGNARLGCGAMPGTVYPCILPGFPPAARTAIDTTMIAYSHRSLRRAYLEWVEEQVEAFKDRVPRGQLLDLADEVCSDLRVSSGGQYQLTELLLCSAINRRIYRMLKLPGFRAWVEQQRADAMAPREPASYDLLAALDEGRPAPTVQTVDVTAVASRIAAAAGCVG
jgi:hypothetical protein